MKGHALFQDEMILKLRTFIDEILKSYTLLNHSTNLNQTWHKALFGEEESLDKYLQIRNIHFLKKR